MQLAIDPIYYLSCTDNAALQEMVVHDVGTLIDSLLAGGTLQPVLQYIAILNVKTRVVT